MNVLSQPMAIAATQPALLTTFLWMEITGKCQLKCKQCYAKSGPHGTHGEMAEADWFRVTDQFAAMAADASQFMVQFIGGEPTLHPLLPKLVRRALSRRLGVEVFSNLVFVPASVWEVLKLSGVSLATSYYSGKAEEHEAITGRRASHRHTTANIARAVELGIPLRVGVIQVEADQDIDGAYRRLAELGVDDTHVGFDRLREVGRGVREDEESMDQLCGGCSDGNVAILPDGRVTPCVFSRWLTVGNVLESGLDEILTGSTIRRTRATLLDHFRLARELPTPCLPDGTAPPRCEPKSPTPCLPKGTSPPRCEPRNPAPCKPRR